MPEIRVRFGEQHISLNDKSLDTAAWSDEYAWFYVVPSEDGGGTDAYYKFVDDLTVDIWDDYGKYGDTYADVRRSLAIGHYWIFRRSMGQPAIINLAFGVLASALAELTEGYLFSDDGAWQGRPIRSYDFDPLYFNPDNADRLDKASWYENCLISILDEYKGITYEPRYDWFDHNELEPIERLKFYPSGKLFRDGPEPEDRILIMMSQYGRIPYLYIDRTWIGVTEDELLRELWMLDIYMMPSVLRKSPDKVLSILGELDFDRRDISYWANPLCVRDGKAVKRRIIGQS
ncbi:hypothetical protein [Paenibacillus xylaniclasticus]|uniref:hypothetical protein n=1 Tax=Paenibacillus xylaniclasticus TaxID=588083 RepID=UPI000FDA942D|nr:MULTISPECIES: hypothetical protein [Paenibacillus]GFN34084.1 hypothetical protein PCURB6_43440 [Paenibacillus curdlanolyticus]